MYTSSIKSGSDYEELEKGILILFTDYDIENLKSLEKYITKWNIREEENPKTSKYSIDKNIVLWYK